jgi:polar amino acid transport system substrate-binding protein
LNLFSILFFNSFSAQATAPAMQKISIITHESRPYLAADLPDQGAGVYALRKCLKKMNYDLQINFVSSWKRAKAVALSDSTVDGYFPYATVESEETFIFSKSFFKGLWIIVERKDHPIHWKKFEDLGKYVGGNVLGVELRPGIKELADSKVLNIENAPDDVSNLRKLATNRVDYVFMNPLTFAYHMAQDPELKPYKGKLQVNSKPIAQSDYGMALKKAHFNKKFMNEFDRIAAQDFNKYIDEYISRLDKEAK